MAVETKNAMEEARKAVEEFMARAGHHDTTVHERVAPAVTHETITKTHHEELLTALNKEIHQDHYHISVQPINEEETLPEHHSFNLIEIERRTFDHDDLEEVGRRLAEEHGKFKDEVFHVERERTRTELDIMAGEHIHHHVHETIQPIVHRHIIEPHIIHTTVPIHEVHHNAAQHHASSYLQAVTLAEFRKQGGVLTGREERYDGFEGEPRSVGKALGGNNSGSKPTSSQTGAAGNNSGSTSQHSSNPTAPTAAPKTAATGAAPAPSAAKPSLLDRANPQNADNSQSRSATQGAGSTSAAPATSQTTGASSSAPQQPSAAPPAPPLPPKDPAHAPVSSTRTPTQALTSPATYLPVRAYHSRHPAGVTGARPLPESNAGEGAHRANEDSGDL